MFTLTRTNFADNGIFGILTDVSDNIVAYTLEHSYNKIPKLPNGTYTCVRGQHALHSGPIETFEITGVTGHSGILFHYGNYNADSDGCVLLGTGETTAAVTDSRDAFSNFMSRLMGINSFTLIVTQD